MRSLHRVCYNPIRMSGLAQRFRRAREAGNISIDQVARATRIKSRYLNAIEDGDFAQLPDGPASRGFIKNYARFLGLDPEEALLQFEAEFGIPILQLRDEVPPPPERVPMVSEYTRVAHPNLLWKGNLPNQDDVALDDDALLDGNSTGTGISVPEISGIDGKTGRAVVLRPSPKPRTAQSSFRLRGSLSSPILNNGRNSRKRSSGRPSIYNIDRSIFPDRGPLMPGRRRCPRTRRRARVRRHPRRQRYRLVRSSTDRHAQSRRHARSRRHPNARCPSADCAAHHHPRPSRRRARRWQRRRYPRPQCASHRNSAGFSSPRRRLSARHLRA